MTRHHCSVASAQDVGNGRIEFPITLNNYVKLAGRVAAEMPNAIWANQFDNVVNRQAHYETTGPEIWRDTGGRIDAFVCATGTGVRWPVSRGI